MSYTLNLYNVICQLYLNKTGKSYSVQKDLYGFCLLTGPWLISRTSFFLRESTFNLWDRGRYGGGDEHGDTFSH